MRNRADVLDLAILGRLADGPQHGYELRKSLMTSLGVFRTLSFGSLMGSDYHDGGTAGRATHPR